MSDQNQVLELIEGGMTANDLVNEIDPKLEADFYKLCKSMATYLDRVKKRFPDAKYFTGSGGFNLMLGDSHDHNGRPQHDLLAFSGGHIVSIGDGDF